MVTDLTSWRLIFWAYRPLAAVLGLVIAVSVPADPREGPAQSLNLAGALAFTAAVMAFIVGSTVITPAGIDRRRLLEARYAPHPPGGYT